MFKKFILCLFIFLIVIVIFSSSTTTSLYHPLREKYIVTSNYGMRTINGNSEFHAGIDYATPLGTEVFAMSSGIVTYSGFDISGGNMVIILYDNGYKSMYCHLAENIAVKKGERVDYTTIVGTVGPKYLKNGMLNGYTTGVHFHFSLYYTNKLVDPSTIFFSTNDLDYQ